MGDHILSLTPALEAKLATMVQTHNDRTGANLTIAEWAVLHLRERAIAEDIGEEVQVLERQSQRDLQAAVLAKKAELMAALDVDAPAVPVIP